MAEYFFQFADQRHQVAYRISTTSLNEVLILEAPEFVDERGAFSETFNAREFSLATGTSVTFVQDNEVRSTRNVLRGLHFQSVDPQGKLVRVLAGEIFDVAVDVRPESSAYGRWFGMILRGADRKQLWIPAGFAHGYLVMSEEAVVLYKTTTYRKADSEKVVAWHDHSIGIAWPLSGEAILAERDRCAPLLKDLNFEWS